MWTTYILLGFSHENIVSRIVSPDVGLKKKKKTGLYTELYLIA